MLGNVDLGEEGVEYGLKGNLYKAYIRNCSGFFPLGTKY